MSRVAPVHRVVTAVGVAISMTLAVLIVAVQPATSAPARTLMLATWNVCKIDCEAPAPGWGIRRERVARVIAQSGADVIAIDEATDWDYNSRTQWEDIQGLASSSGYASPAIQDDQCRRLGCTHTARLLIKSATVSQMDFGSTPSAGYWRVRDIAPTVTFDALRQVAWAFLEGRNGTGPFFVFGVHLTTDKGAAGESHRIAFGKAATAWAESMTASRGLAGAPIFLLGDLNSIETRQPHGVQKVLTTSGWKDAIDAPVRKNTDINSVNYSDVSRSGWPARPIRNRYRLASRIDYLLYRGPVKAMTYEVVAYLNANGTYKKDYQGSDHQMIRARMLFTGFTPAAGSPATSPTPAPAGVPNPSPRPAPTSSVAPTAPQPPASMVGSAFAERSISVYVPTAYTATATKGAYRTITARSDGTTLEALLKGAWVPIPYRYDEDYDALLPQPYLYDRLGGDPLGGVGPSR